MKKKDKLPVHVSEIIQTASKSFSEIINAKFEVDLIEIQNIKIKDFQRPEINVTIKYPEYYNDNIGKHLNDKALPSIYVFEAVSPDYETIIKAFNSYKNSESAKPCSAVKNPPPIKKAKCLYIGKSETKIKNRLLAHLGYYTTKESSLQLLHWACDIDLICNIKIFQFNNEMRDFIKVLEKPFHKEMIPLIGHL